MNREQAWKFNVWMSVNGSFILWVFLTIATALQQFEATEPLVLGAWWISVFSLFGGVAAAGKMFHIHDPRSVYIQIAAQILGVLLQIYLVAFHWETLCKIDHVLKVIRMVITIPVGGDHLLPLRLVWLGFTVDFWLRRYRRGFVFYEIGKMPW